jgi:hypothetical protein
MPLPKEVVSSDIMGKQENAAVNWLQTGNCNALSNITQPTLIIVGSDDLFTRARQLNNTSTKDSWIMVDSNRRCRPWIDVSIS